MPTYDYRCETGHRYEKRQPFGSPSEHPCDRCGKTARRVLHAPPVVFKGSGWYQTDSRSKSRSSKRKDSDKEPAKASSESTQSDSSTSSTGDSSTSSTGDSKPKSD